MAFHGNRAGDLIVDGEVVFGGLQLDGPDGFAGCDHFRVELDAVVIARPQLHGRDWTATPL